MRLEKKTVVTYLFTVIEQYLITILAYHDISHMHKLIILGMNLWWFNSCQDKKYYCESIDSSGGDW